MRGRRNKGESEVRSRLCMQTRKQTVKYSRVKDAWHWKNSWCLHYSRVKTAWRGDSDWAKRSMEYVNVKKVLQIRAYSRYVRSNQRHCKVWDSAHNYQLLVTQCVAANDWACQVAYKISGTVSDWLSDDSDNDSDSDSDSDSELLAQCCHWKWQWQWWQWVAGTVLSVTVTVTVTVTVSY
jgi:hypothetical protein